MLVVAPPLQEVREAVYSRLETHAATSGYELAKEGQSADMPYLVVGPAYKGAGGTDPEFEVRVIVQVDAYASSLKGGSKQVSSMIEDVYTAFSDDFEFGASLRPIAILPEDDVLNPALQDQRGGEMYAQRYVRFRFHVTT